ncbi:MAG: hypothetical protein B6I20_09250 [Bacteroidetes bacterium 4572_117]|nr:MAG: hypothetical protein B6I20_09250 [Bacteroidetes bacterium 4572_117]
MNLIIDVGNTLIKLFFIEKGNICYTKQFKSVDKMEVFNVLNDDNNPVDYAIISSVIGLSDSYYALLRKYFNNLVVLDEHTKLPIVNKYKTSATLGKDRIAAIVGAHTIFPDTNVLVFDAGTALTIDFVSAKGEFCGGNISPGLTMRFKALNYYTNKLPLVKSEDFFPLIAKSTKKAIIAGVQNGLIFEIDGYISEFKQKYNDLNVILTGGDSFFFAHKLKNPIFAEPFLTAIGLNRILEYYVE